MPESRTQHFRDWRAVELVAAILFLPWMCLIFSNACPTGALRPLLTVLVWGSVALSCTIRIMLPRRIRHQYRLRFTNKPLRTILDWTPPALLLISLIVSTGAGRSLRFSLSENALTRLAQEVKLEPGEWRSINRKVGLYEVSNAERIDNTLYFSTGHTGVFFDECGYAYSPDGPLEDRPALISLGHMSGHWYRYHFIE